MTRRRKARRFPKGVHVFNLHPERDSRFHKGSQGALFIRVLVFQNARALYAYRPLERKHAGCCTELRNISFRSGKRGRVQPIVAEVCLHRGRLGIEVVTHELLHAAIAYARRFVFNFCRLDAIDSVNDQEEWFVHILSSLCRQFMVRAIAAGLYTEASVVVKADADFKPGKVA